MQGVTGGTAGLAGFENSLTNMGTGVAKASQNLAEYSGKMSLSGQQFAQSLTSFTGKGAAAWQNFDQVVGSTAPQMIDWLRQAGTEGALSGTQFTTAVRDMVAQMLPLASHSKVATSELDDLAQQAGGPTTDNFKTLKDWVDQGHLSIAGLSRIVSDATEKMGNMSQVAQQLGTVMNQQVASAISNAALKANGFYSDVNNLTEAMAHNGTYGGHTAAYWANVAGQAFNTAGSQAQTAAGKVGNLAGAMARLHSQTVDINVVTNYSSTGNPVTAPAGVGLGHLQPGGHAAGTNSARAGVALVGEEGPELMMMRGGEQVVPHRETASLLAIAAAVRHATAYQGGTPGAARRAAEVFASPGAGVGGGPTVVHVHVAGSVHNEQSLARAVQTAINQKTIRNGSTQLFLNQRRH